MKRGGENKVAVITERASSSSFSSAAAAAAATVALISCPILLVPRTVYGTTVCSGSQLLLTTCNWLRTDSFFLSYHTPFSYVRYSLHHQSSSSSSSSCLFVPVIL